jgi:hypothetical protein
MTMNADDEQDREEVGARLLDDAYRAWDLAEVQCGLALRRWDRAEPDDEAAAFWCYTAALDREEAAARELERLCESAVACPELLGRRRARVS